MKFSEGVNVIKTCKCSEGYFSYTSIKFGGFEYHNEIPTKLIGQKSLVANGTEIIDGG